MDFKAFCDLQNEITKCIKETVSLRANTVVFDKDEIKRKLPEDIKNFMMKDISKAGTRNRAHSPPKFDSPVSPTPGPSRKRSRDAGKSEFSGQSEVPEFSDRPLPKDFKAKISVDCLNA
ncbi:unnamed protein product [Cylicostephanus goldi]|uniref:Uncharacterized protein n=1 Tax=Cylicostephanus goldi TaxID=71465 RepID=A0A3P6SFC4_CYLGO|nr:unnamed protein product [Cylicostephanus goldi]